MRIVFLNQYYPPDAAPTGMMLQGVAEQLAKDGHDVTVFCASGGYADEKVASDEFSVFSEEVVEAKPGMVSIIRIGATKFGRGTFLGKLLDYLSYYLGVAWKLMVMKPRPDRIVAMTTPPYLSVLARGISRLRGGDHAHWVMDLYPDVMTAHGMLRENGFPCRMLAALTRSGFGGRRCVSVLALGPDMVKRLERYLPKKSQDKLGSRIVEWVPLWESVENGGHADCPDEITNYDELRRSRGWTKDELVVMYSGNMGLGHPMAEALAAAKELKGSPVRFVFYGRGKRRGEVERFIRENPECWVEINDYAPAEMLGAHLRSADVHLVSLDPAWTGTMVPSKLQGVFSIGRPVIFIGSKESSVGRWVAESGGGWIVPPGEPERLLAAISDAKDDKERIRCGNAAASFSNTFFNRAKNIERTCRILTARK